MEVIPGIRHEGGYSTAEPSSLANFSQLDKVRLNVTRRDRATTKGRVSEEGKELLSLSSDHKKKNQSAIPGVECTVKSDTS